MAEKSLENSVSHEVVDRSDNCMTNAIKSDANNDNHLANRKTIAIGRKISIKSNKSTKSDKSDPQFSQYNANDSHNTNGKEYAIISYQFIFVVLIH